MRNRNLLTTVEGIRGGQHGIVKQWMLLSMTLPMPRKMLPAVGGAGMGRARSLHKRWTAPSPPLGAAACL